MVPVRRISEITLETKNVELIASVVKQSPAVLEYSGERVAWMLLDDSSGQIRVVFSGEYVK